MRQYNRRSVEILAKTSETIISIAEAKAFLRIDGNDDDALIGILINTAIQSAETYTRRAIGAIDVELTMDGFAMADDDAIVNLGAGWHQIPPWYVMGRGSEIDLPYPPINSITSITTFNRQNVAAVFPSASYILDGFRVSLNEGVTWPTELRHRAGVKVRYSAGYGEAKLPTPIKLAMMQHIVAMYECRGGCDIPAAAKVGLDPYRIRDGMTW